MSEQTLSDQHEQVVNLHHVAALQEVAVREGVVLRPMQDEDAPAIIGILEADPGIRYRVSVAAKMTSEDAVRQEVADYQRDPSLIRYALCENGTCIGLVSFWGDDGFFGQIPEPNTYGFGYMLHPDDRGRGLIRASIEALMQTAVGNFQVDRFIAFCTDDNRDSIATLESLGFEPTETVYSEPNEGWAERMHERRVT